MHLKRPLIVAQDEKNVSTLLKESEALLSESGIDDARKEAELLLMHALDLKRHELYLHNDKVVSGEPLSAFESWVQRRLSNEPSQYIIGEAAFRDILLEVGPTVLIPRPETETLVGLAIDELSKIKGNALTLDICTGSGCVAVAIAKEVEGARVFATDISIEAVNVARRNAIKNEVEGRVEVFVGDLFSPLEGKGFEKAFQVITGNPPYVTSADFEKLEPEVRLFEPKEALIGGKDGLDFYRRIRKEFLRWLAPGGAIFLEVGYDQAESVSGLFKDVCSTSVVKDLFGKERIVIARLSA